MAGAEWDRRAQHWGSELRGRQSSPPPEGAEERGNMWMMIPSSQVSPARKSLHPLLAFEVTNPHFKMASAMCTQALAAAPAAVRGNVNRASAAPVQRAAFLGGRVAHTIASKQQVRGAGWSAPRRSMLLILLQWAAAASSALPLFGCPAKPPNCASRQCGWRAVWRLHRPCRRPAAAAAPPLCRR